MSLGAVVAVAQQVCYDGRGYLGDEVLQCGVACSEQVDTQSAKRHHHGVWIEVLAGTVAGESHGLVTMPPAVRRLGRLSKWCWIMPAKGSGTGTGSAPSDMRVSWGATTIAAVGRATILIRG